MTSARYNFKMVLYYNNRISMYDLYLIREFLDKQFLQRYNKRKSSRYWTKHIIMYDFFSEDRTIIFTIENAEYVRELKKIQWATEEEVKRKFSKVIDKIECVHTRVY